MTTFVFRVRNIPAALYKAMGGFATNGVNMTKLESYMVGGAFTATQFYADVEGHPDDPALRARARRARLLLRPSGGAGDVSGRSAAGVEGGSERRFEPVLMPLGTRHDPNGGNGDCVLFF